MQRPDLKPISAERLAETTHSGEKFIEKRRPKPPALNLEFKSDDRMKERQFGAVPESGTALESDQNN